MANDKMMAQISEKGGFIAALDQSGGSDARSALRHFCTAFRQRRYRRCEMFRLVHGCGVRIMTAAAFTGAKVIRDDPVAKARRGRGRGKPTPAFL